MLVAFPVASRAQTAPDLLTLRGRWESWETSANGPAEVLLRHARELAASEGPDGCWTSVAYADQARSVWRASVHLENLAVLADASYELRRQETADAELDEASVRAMRCWLRRDPKNPNWWWNEIGAPQAIGRSALLLQPLLSPDDHAAIDVVLRRSNWSAWTGQNLAWGVNVQIMRGLFDGDGAVVKQAFDRLYEEIRIAPVTTADGKPGEGVEADDSFHQHGAQLYSGGYGYGFGVDVGRDLVLSWGTGFQVPARQMEIFSAFLLDGQQWMIRCGTFDYVARGREITRAEHAGLGNAPEGLTRVVDALAVLQTPRKAEFVRFAGTLKPSGCASGVGGNRYFWSSDLMEQKRAGYATSVRMFSTRTRNEEIVNGEGLRSMHLADGANLLYKSGEEYRGIFPVWNWTLIPGTTAMQWISAKGVPLTGETQSVGQMGSSSFAGGVSDGTYGAAAMELERGPLSARKAWFFFDKLYVAVGAGISVREGAGVPEVRVATSIAQSKLVGAVERKRLPDGTEVIDHDGTGYVVSPGESVVLSTGEQTGRWSDLGTGSDAVVRLPVFNLSVDHGVRPRDGVYEYKVLPGSDFGAAQREAKQPSVVVLTNSAEVQAVYSAADRLVEAVFYRAGTVETTLGRVSVDRACMVLVRASADGVRVTASNPDAEPVELAVSVGGRTATFQLRGGEDGGKSETLVLGK